MNQMWQAAKALISRNLLKRCWIVGGWIKRCHWKVIHICVESYCRPKKSVNVKTAASYSCSTFDLSSFAMGTMKTKRSTSDAKTCFAIASSLLSQSDYARISHAFGRRLVFNIFD
jgi:hypothetical protein